MGDTGLPLPRAALSLRLKRKGACVRAAGEMCMHLGTSQSLLYPYFLPSVQLPPTLECRTSLDEVSLPK